MRTPSERFEKSITRDNLWIYILSLLKTKDLYPYEIREKIQEKFGFKPGNVTAYLVLGRLKRGGYVKLSKSEKVSGPERSYYKMTPKGLEELKKAKKIYEKTLSFLEKSF